ncbi:hypothetical protein PWG71_11410 [Nocardiopsis sp. N85]|uniref:hypothetical protein n=1 Tax=Nocardiopsis sp. N85 TaxID=3029400 RepID=UPI00237F1D6B|nr:hypothetical protein [Nocardiopsis sp. N85]MDE3721998.1 hypothetical protein [Nocardiopsis sp. N85]
MDDPSFSTPSEYGNVSNEVTASYISRLLQARDIYGVVYFGDVEHLRPQSLPSAYQDYLMEVHIARDREEYDAFRELVRAERFGYIVGAPGNGREITAVAVLRSCGFNVDTIPVADGDERLISRSPHARGRGYVLDLSDLEGDVTEALREVEGFQERANRAGAAVIVILRPTQIPHERLLSRPLKVSATDALTVFSSHLFHLTGRSAEPWAEIPEIKVALDRATPADAVRLARVALEVLSEATDFPEWVALTLAAYRNWQAELRRWFSENRGEEGIWNRVVLTATAMLEGLSVTSVLTAADTLAEHFRVPSGRSGGIAGTGVDEALERIDAMHENGERVRFNRPDYADAVMDHLWSQHPLTRKRVLAWSEALILGNTGDHSVVLADCWSRFVIRHRDEALANEVFNSWVKKSGTADAAARFAARIVTVPGFGRRMRRRLYEAAKSPDQTQARVIARTCVELGAVDPGAALVRLRRLADTEDERIRAEVHNALTRLAAASDEGWSAIMTEVVSWTGTEGSRARTALTFIVRVLSAEETDDPGRAGAPSALVALSDAAERSGDTADEMYTTLKHLWRVVMDCGDDDLDLVSVAARPWIAQVLEERTLRNYAIGVLFHAARGPEESTDPEISQRIVTMTRAIEIWCADHADRFDRTEPIVYDLHSLLHEARFRHRPSHW